MSTDKAPADDIEWPRYVRCDGAECPVQWEHWHWVNEDGTAAS